MAYPDASSSLALDSLFTNGTVNGLAIQAINVGISTASQILTSPVTLGCEILNFPFPSYLLGSHFHLHPDNYGLNFPSDFMSLTGGGRLQSLLQTDFSRAYADFKADNPGLELFH